MPAETINPSAIARGEVRAHYVMPAADYAARLLASPVVEPFRLITPGTPQDWRPVSKFKPNLFLYEWGAIFANLLLRKGLNYGVGGMYLEFENVASPGDPVAAPDYGRGADQGVEYYAALSGSPDRDYVRVPLVAGTLTSTDAATFPNGNLASFFAQTAGVEGVHGKPFSDVNNSVVFGGALVAFVDEADHTRDLVLSRFYFDVADQVPKLATGQVGLEWRLNLQ